MVNFPGDKRLRMQRKFKYSIEQFTRFSEIRLILRPEAGNGADEKLRRNEGEEKRSTRPRRVRSQCSLYSCCCKNFHRAAEQSGTRRGAHVVRNIKGRHKWKRKDSAVK